MKKYLCVLHDYESGDFCEPGVSKMPSLDLQRKAIDVLLQKRDAKQVQELRTGTGQKLSTTDLNFETDQFSGIVFFSSESLRTKNREIDLMLFNSLYEEFAEIFIIVESISIENEQEYLSVSKRFIALNYCAQRDASDEWKDLVSQVTIGGKNQ
jgi:hypothetical protein